MSDDPIDAVLGGRIADLERQAFGATPGVSFATALIVEKDGKRYEVCAYDDQGRAPLYAEEREIVLPSDEALRHVRQLCEELAATSWPIGSREWVEAAQITLDACLRLATHCAKARGAE